MLIKRVAKKIIPTYVKKQIDSLRKKYKYIGNERYCAACQRGSSHFLDFDLRPLNVLDGVIDPVIVPETKCPWCGSHLHHRLMWTILPDIIGDIKTKAQNRLVRILHFAPEKFSVPRFEVLSNTHYITTDYIRNDVQVKLDMCNLGCASDKFHLIIASHVLEHVPDDKLAFKELLRILKPGGYAVILVPLLVKESYEYDNVTNETDKIRLYGQSDHLRAYGMDIAGRITECGFELKVMHARSYPELSQPSYLLDRQGVLFLAKKPE